MYHIFTAALRGEKGGGMVLKSGEMQILTSKSMRRYFLKIKTKVMRQILLIEKVFRLFQ